MTVERLGVAEASAHMLAAVAPVAVEELSLADSLGRVLARDVSSTVWLPPWDNASMDGFAARETDVRGASDARPLTLRVVATIAAGGTNDVVLDAGEAARIMTGAPIPGGADSVIRVEDSAEMGGDGHVTITNDRDASRNIRRRGEDVRPGSVVGRAGATITPAQLGVLASVGSARVVVFRRPRVAILATGDELVPVEDFAAVQAGRRIVSSNSYALAAAVRDAGGEPVELGIAPDDPDRLATILRGAEGCDLLLTSGGVSVGDFDYTRRVVMSLGGTLSLWRVRMRPGAPLGYGALFGAPWLGLPGNPVSALVTFELFGRPLVRALAGHRLVHRRTIAVIAESPVNIAAPLTHYLRVTLGDDVNGVPLARLTGSQSSGMLTSMSTADALMIIPPDPLQRGAGSMLRAIPLTGGIGGSDTFPG